METVQCDNTQNETFSGFNLFDSFLRRRSRGEEDDENSSFFLQPVWKLFLRNGEYASSPLFPISVGVVFYFLCLLPFCFLDYFGRNWNWVRRHKIQPETEVAWSMTRDAILLTVWNQVLVVLPVSVSQAVWTPRTRLPDGAPALWEFVWQHYVALVIVDVQYYLWHVLHHRVRFLYHYVHSVHHRYSTINCWVGQYVHPWELICGGVFGTTAPWVLGCHPLTTWSFMIFLNFLSIDDHSGYDFPFVPHRWIPFYGGSARHDLHHQRPQTNLQPYFVWFDYVLGTNCVPEDDSPNRKQLKDKND